MIEPADFLRVVIDPGLRFTTEVMAKDMATEQAKVILLAICLQESGLQYRRQIDDNGQPRTPADVYARGFAQFEKGGGVHGVCTHAASKDAAKIICDKLHISFDDSTIHDAMAWNDYLAIAFARLLLYTDAAPLPAIGDQQGAFQYYLRNWRPKGWENPSQEKIDRWAKYYPVAVAAVAAAAATPSVPFIAAPKPGTLTATTGAGKSVQVDLPTMNRSWTTGDFWLNVLSTLGVILLALSPIVEPLMDNVATSPWLLSIPLGPALFAAARQYYKGQRMKYAAEVASAAAKQGNHT